MNTTPLPPVVGCFGELLLRFTPPGMERLVQARAFELFVGGAEANVACGLASLGLEAWMLSRVPAHEVGQICVDFLRSRAVGTGHIVRGGERLGTYYYEQGAGPRGGKVVYDRVGSAFADWQLTPAEAQGWVSGLGLLHLSGISPAVSAQAAANCTAVLEAAAARGIPISFDLNYRSTLWRYGVPPTAIVPQLLAHATVVMADQQAAASMLGLAPPGAELAPEDRYRALGRAIAALGPRIGWVAFTHRGVSDARHGTYSGYLYQAATDTLHRGQVFPLEVIERIGAGDAFCAGLLYGYLHRFGAEAALNFALATGALKHTHPGDALVVTPDEVQRTLEARSPGTIQR